MLMKLTPDVNIINILLVAFKCEDPKSVKIQSSCHYLFVLLGSASIKANRKMLVKLTPDDAQLVHVVRMELENHRQHPDVMFLNVILNLIKK
jgi:hypothetical protein